MTDINKDDMKINKMEARIKRRSLLKAGAIAAPLAMTLHGGIPMAHADSASCVEELKNHVEVPHYDDNGHKDGEERFNPDSGFTNRLNHDGTPETHWDYLENEDLTGASCLQSLENSGNQSSHHSEHDSDHD